MAKFHDEFFKQRDSEHDDLIADIIENIYEVAQLVYRQPIVDGELHDIETERPLKTSNGFFIGYVDVFGIIGRNRMSVRGSHLENFAPCLIVDAKPKPITDFGAVTRQIKTYHELLSMQRSFERTSFPRDKVVGQVLMGIVMCTEPTRAAKVIAENEGIELIVYDKESKTFSKGGKR